MRTIFRKELENEFAEISGGNFSDLVDEVRKEESKNQLEEIKKIHGHILYSKRITR